jgi:hypothetical protein
MTHPRAGEFKHNLTDTMRDRGLGGAKAPEPGGDMMKGSRASDARAGVIGRETLLQA